MSLLLVDGDGILYRCGFAVEKTLYLVLNHDGTTKQYEAFRDIPKDLHPEASVWSRKKQEPVENALFLTKHVIEKLKTRYPDHKVEVWLTPSVGNFREQIATTHKYKGNRDAQVRPKYYKEIQKFLVEEYGAAYARNQEADDELGIRATAVAGSVIVSVDKDLDQIPGRHYNWVTEEEYEIGKKQGLLNFYGQVLSGDTSDNIVGLAGVGPATASKMLRDANNGYDCWQIVLSAYKDQFGEDYEKRAIENARLCWVRRYEGQIWEPPTAKSTEQKAA